MSRHRICGMLFGLAALAGIAVPVTPAYSLEQSVRPGINRYYKNPDFQEWVDRFERSGREVYDKRHRIVAATGVQPNMAVADIGAGTGLFTRLFSPRVGPGGKVYAIDISPVFIDNILRIARRRGLTNVEGVVNTPSDISMPPGSIDLAFICDTYHHFEYPRSTMQSVHRALRPGGTLVIIDFRKIQGLSSPWVMGHVRAGKGVVIKEVEAAGFKLIEDREFLKTNYFLKFVKDK